MTELKVWESYFDPDTYDPMSWFGVLANKLGIKNDGQLHDAEYRMAGARIDKLVSGEYQIPQTFDADHLKAIHRYLFQDVYEWAGEFRRVDMAKDVSEFASIKGGIETYLKEAHKIVAQTHWEWLSQSEFVEESARVFAYVNHAHPFREGNGRTAKMFMIDVSKMSHFEFDFDRIDKNLWNQASMFSGPDIGGHTPHHEELIPVFKMATSRRAPAPAPAPSRPALIATQQLGLPVAQICAAPVPGQQTNTAGPGFGGVGLPVPTPHLGQGIAP